MTLEPNPSTPISPTSRPVLLWQAEGDASRVEPTIEAAGAFLGASADDVAAAIASGDPLEGWFADWEAGPQTTSST